ncbi:hypothetical protein MS3_00000664 [Schistosoma haematobium]|uniref:Uncharacterized protein n=1 Tax=Schistosoma haematobium TaxID=6185 RepID=A0A922IIE2_SCHHA|nr:hypothetical protein MS3_00000664 [Schistosoma haematobium]KAH9580218.1 hypothetical protein MS3_00000664 [Schistosoma haematobium]
MKTFASADKPISLRYATLKQLLLDHIYYTNFEAVKSGNVPEMIRQNIRSPTTSRRHSAVRNRAYLDNRSLSCETVHKDKRMFGKCLFCGMFHSHHSCEIGHIQLVCSTAVHFSATYAKFFKCDPT